MRPKTPRIPPPQRKNLKRFGPLWIETITTVDSSEETDPVLQPTHTYDLVWMQHTTAPKWRLARIDDRAAIAAAIDAQKEPRA